MTGSNQDAEKENTEPNRLAVYQAWALCDFWPLSEAIRLTYSQAPQWPGSGTDETVPPLGTTVEAVALRCAGGSLPVTQAAAFPGELCVRPREFVEWADLKCFKMPGELRMAVDSVAPLTGGSGKPERNLSPKQRHREMCRGIAALLWRDNPDMTIEAMAQRKELRDIGCEGMAYTHDTMRNWIKEQAPNRQPGRRPIAPKTPL